MEGCASERLPIVECTESRSNLASIYLLHATESFPERPIATADLEEKLFLIVERAKDNWPTIQLSAEGFVAFLGRCVPADALANPDTLRVGDLYLVYAYGHGLAAAHEALEQRHLGRARAALRRIGAPEAQIADILQELRRRLIEMRHPSHGQKSYQGRGDLGAWLCVSAVREAGLQRKRRSREFPIEAVCGSFSMLSDKDSEAALLEKTCKPEFTGALREAMATLDTKERTVLRYHFIDHLTIDHIGVLYGVHRATAARWISQARETLCARTIDFLRRRIPVSEESFNRMAVLLESQLQTEIDALLDPLLPDE